MKNTFKILFALLVAAGLWSCEGEDNFMYIDPQEAAFAIITPDAGSSILLTEDTMNNVAATFSWQPVSYGTPTAITYFVEVAANGTDFAEPIVLASSGTTSVSVTVKELNSAALEAGLDSEEEGALDVRIRATVGTMGSEPIFSDMITLLLTPYPDGFLNLYFVGEATSAGWNPAGVDNAKNNLVMFRDPINKDLYTFTGYFGAGQFKLLEVLGQWQPQWGTNDGTTLAVNEGGGSDPGAFISPSAGYHKFTINLAENTFLIAPYDASLAPTFTTVGIIGDATANGWDASTAMTKDSADPHKWYILNVNLSNGFIKFRANNAWDVNWGANTAISGTGTQGGANIPVEAGKYNIYFNDLDGMYILVEVP